MTTRFYRLMFIIVAALMSLVGCNKTTSGDNDQYKENEFEDTLYGCESIYYDDADVDQPNIPDIDEDHYYPDTVYGDPGVDFDDSVDNDTDTTDADIEEENDDYDSFATEYGTPADFDVYPDETFDADIDEYEDALLYGDPYTEYDADLGNDDDEIIGTDDDQ